MPRRQTITQTEVKRILKGAAEAGLKVGRFEVDPATGRLIVTVGEGNAAPEMTAREQWRASRGSR
ncbi:hypothetical protein [Methylobacterium sp. WSM2598]|uniref:hypothetical protein n=1 Tax=Methylobacterium sp. WSM2598 TaxID=398261 RepID=UPI000375B636|nr:hypothetical protein [Methylobacterium sp. WSM2598]